jgi:hypothetical protein
LFLTQYVDAKAETVFATPRGSADAAASRVARERSLSALAAIPPGEWLPRNGWEPETTTLNSWTRQHGRKTPAPLDESSGEVSRWLGPGDTVTMDPPGVGRIAYQIK